MNGKILLESRATKMMKHSLICGFLSDPVIHPAAFQQKTQRTSFRWPFSESLHTCVGNPNHLSQSLDLHLERSVRLELSAWALIVWSLLLGPRLGAETNPAGFWIFPEPCSLSGWTLADLCLFPLRARVQLAPSTSRAFYWILIKLWCHLIFCQHVQWDKTKRCSQRTRKQSLPVYMSLA